MHLITAKKNKEPRTRKSLPFRKWRFREKGSQENEQKPEKDQTETATGLGRRTKEEIEKSGIKLTAEIPDGGRHHKYPASLRGESVSNKKYRY